jgi:hypothetical protein
LQIQHRSIAAGIRAWLTGLCGALVIGCGASYDIEYSENITVEGALRCCVIFSDEDIPEPKTTGWYIELGSPLKIGRRSLKEIEVFPIYRFQIEEMERFHGKQVRAAGFIKRAFAMERNDWVYGLKLISIEAAGEEHAPAGIEMLE